MKTRDDVLGLDADLALAGLADEGLRPRRAAGAGIPLGPVTVGRGSAVALPAERVRAGGTRCPLRGGLRRFRHRFHDVGLVNVEDQKGQDERDQNPAFH